ncbi:hypothetical protein [Sphingomonas elodea]|uniref:hypothetical protein n=1 Tax=Sphingomonas elodea TaxID=179878 RepID=UPI0002D5D40A|nr:hypothetical protein [Sphingomonas elodea]
MEDDDPPTPSIWDEEPGPLAKGLGWGCLLVLALPIAYYFFFLLTFCEINCS